MNKFFAFAASIPIIGLLAVVVNLQAQISSIDARLDSQAALVSAPDEKAEQLPARQKNQFIPADYFSALSKSPLVEKPTVSRTNGSHKQSDAAIIYLNADLDKGLPYLNTHEQVRREKGLTMSVDDVEAYVVEAAHRRTIGMPIDVDRSGAWVN